MRAHVHENKVIIDIAIHCSRWEIAPTAVNAYYEPLYNEFG